jgi:hypothetical protein
VPGDSIYGGFGNVVSDGYGICYILKRNRFDVSIVTDKPLSAKKMGIALGMFRSTINTGFVLFLALFDFIRDANFFIKIIKFSCHFVHCRFVSFA